MQWPATLLWWRLQLFLIWVCWSKPIIIPKRRTGPQCRHLGCLSPYASGYLILTVSVIHTCSLGPTQSLSSLSILTRFSSRINISLEAPVSSRKCDPAPTPVCSAGRGLLLTCSGMPRSLFHWKSSFLDSANQALAWPCLLHSGLSYYVDIIWNEKNKTVNFSVSNVVCYLLFPCVFVWIGVSYVFQVACNLQPETSIVLFKLDIIHCLLNIFSCLEILEIRPLTFENL